MHIRSLLAPIFMLVVAAAPANATQYYPPDVTQAIDAYMQERRDAVESAGKPNPTRNPSDLVAETDALAAAIQARRKDDPEGSVFDERTAAAIRTRISSLFSTNGPGFRHLILDVQPEQFAVAVNMRYPGGQPRSAMPPTLLSALPVIPPELAYRFVGPHLLLLDRPTGVVVDVVRDALPLSGTGSGDRPS